MSLRRRLFKILFYGIGFLGFLYSLFVGGLLLLEVIMLTQDVSFQSTRAESKNPNSMILLDRGIDSFYHRIRLIRQAQKSIELEFFIYSLDESARLFTEEIIKKADQGVKVRLLLDFAVPVMQLKPAYAKILEEHGIEVKYYNPAPIYRFIYAQHRSHRKLLIVDDRYAITGGRNIANEYFDLKKDYNFIDSDVLVEGDIVPKVRESFDVYFHSDQASQPKQKIKDKPLKKAREGLRVKPDDLVILEKMFSLAQKKLPAYICRDTVFVTDPPFHGEANRLVFNAIVEGASKAEKTIFVETPYFVIRDQGFDNGYVLLKKLSEKGIDVRVLTNSLHSTDATYAVGALFFKLRKLSKINITLYAMDGRAVEGQSDLTWAGHERWGQHAKRAVLDGKHSMIGTYNIDPRSANLNSEMMFICRDNPELASAIMASIDQRLKVSKVILNKGQFADVKGLFAGATTSHLLMFVVLLPLATLFDFLL